MPEDITYRSALVKIMARCLTTPEPVFTPEYVAKGRHYATMSQYRYWKSRVVMMSILLSLAAPEVVVTTTTGAVSDYKVGIKILYISVTHFDIWGFPFAHKKEMPRYISLYSSRDVTPHPLLLNRLRPGQNGRHFADVIFKCIFWNGNGYIWLNFYCQELLIHHHWLR